MDIQQQQKKLLGFFGILKETFKIIFSQKKIFSKITLALIIPLSFIFQANIVASYLLSSKIFKKRDSLHPADLGLSSYSNLNFSDTISSKWVAYWILIEIACYSLILMFCVLCTSSVVHTIYRIYTAKDITFKKSIAVVSKVWKRVLTTFLLSFFIVFLYDFVLAAILVLILRLLFNGFAVIIAIIILILFLAGSVYISVIWHLATVVSVMEEDVYGTKAITKSRKLIKPKFGVAVVMLIIFSACSFAIDAAFENFVVRDLLPNVGIRIGIGIVLFLLQLLLILFGLVIQTVIYFVCKSYHNEKFEVNSEVHFPYQKALHVQSEQLPI